MPGAEILGQSLRCLPYDLKLSDDCILPVRGREENIATDCDVGGDLLSGVHYVPEVDVVTCHRTTASLSTCSRMYGLMAASVTTSTLQPSKSSRSCFMAMRSSRLRPASSFTRISTSLSGPAVPRTLEPKTRTSRAPWLAATRSIVSRLSFKMLSIPIAWPLDS